MKSQFKAFLPFGGLMLVLIAWTRGVGQDSSKVKLEGNENRRQLLSSIQGKPAPELEIAEWMGSKPIKLSELKGKVVLLDFWGKW